jgi:hypothetical protein
MPAPLKCCRCKNDSASAGNARETALVSSWSSRRFAHALPHVEEAALRSEALSSLVCEKRPHPVNGHEGRSPLVEVLD